MQIHELGPRPDYPNPVYVQELVRFWRGATDQQRLAMRVALKMQDREEVLRLLAPYMDTAMAEAKKKKRRRSAKKRPFAYGVYGGWFYPGAHNGAGTQDSSSEGGDAGGESLRENRESNDDIIRRFAASCADYLGLTHVPRLRLRRDPEWTRRNGTFGRYTAEPEPMIEIATAGRHIVDVLRTLAHEMTHAHQDATTGLPDHAGETGSDWENEANARAGEIMRHWAQQEPGLFKNVQLEESSGYIPTEAERNDPRFSMALTQDIQPGETGRQANRLGLKTDSQGRPQLLMKRLANLLESVKQGQDQDLIEVAMSPGELRRWADSAAAQGIRVGIEYELIFPDTAGDDDDDEDYEPDYGMDQRADSIDEVIDFFQGGDNGIAPRTAERLRRDLYEEFMDWAVESFDDNVGESEFVDWMEENIWPDVEDQYRDQAREELGDDADDDAITEQAVKLFREEAESQYQDRGDWYDQAYESLMDDYRSNVDEGDWLRENYRYMSDIENAWSVDWPYYRSTGRDAGDIDWSGWADEIAGVVDMPVRVSQGYHSAKRTADSWIMEPDSSLEPSNDEDAGIELISPPLPLPEALAKFDAISAWARSRGVYTNSSTGLHMNISIPVSEVDYVKLILFMGDQYVLDQFGRGANSYTRSAYEKISDLVRSKRRSVREVTQSSPGVYSGGVDIAAAMELMKKNLIELAGRYVQGGVGGSKYTSAHVKDTGKGTYIEFRGPGNDWLDDRESVKTARDTMLRFARAMTIAGDPSAERREYAKKFYKLLSGYRSAETVKTGKDTRYQTRIDTDDEDPFAQLFAKYSSGMISGQELKREWADTVLNQQRDREARAPFTAGDQGQDYEIFDRGTGEVLDRLTGYTDDQTAVIRARQLYSGTNVNYGIRRAAAAQDPKKKTDRRAELAQRVTRSTRDVGEQLWRVNHHSSQQWVTARSQAEAVAKAIQQDRMFDNPETRARIATDTERQQWQLDQLRRQQRDQQDTTDGPPGFRIANDPRQTTQGEFTGRWLIRDAQGRELHTFGGVGNSQADANRFAARWLGQVYPNLSGTEVEVVPEMR